MSMQKLCFHGQKNLMEELAVLVSCLVGSMPRGSQHDDQDMSWISPNLAGHSSTATFILSLAFTLHRRVRITRWEYPLRPVLPLGIKELLRFAVSAKQHLDEWTNYNRAVKKGAWSGKTSVEYSVIFPGRNIEAWKPICNLRSVFPGSSPGFFLPFCLKTKKQTNLSVHQQMTS